MATPLLSPYSIIDSTRKLFAKDDTSFYGQFCPKTPRKVSGGVILDVTLGNSNRWPRLIKRRHSYWHWKN